VSDALGRPRGRGYVVRTFGCQMNEHDSERISGLLQSDGLRSVDDEADADVVVLNTCCIREHADAKLYGTLGTLARWKAERPGRQIVVAGCLAQKDRDAVRRRAPQVDVVMGTHNVHRAAALLDEARSGGPVVEILEEAVEDDHLRFPSALPVRREVDYNAWVTIQIGCDNTCAYCIVPAVRGREISRPFDEIVEEVRRLAADGVTQVSLLGQNVNSYGRDLALAARREGRAGGDGTAGREATGTGAGSAAAGARAGAGPMFADLLRAVGAVPGIRRVRFVSPHPKDMRTDVLAAMAETPSVCEHLHYPLQSGSDAVLAAMHRGYTAARYLARLAEARARIADLAVTTDVIVGFPGETEADFAATLEVCAEAGFDAAYSFVFSPRPGTAAAAMTDRVVDPAVVRDRYDRLKVVLDRVALVRHRARIGRVEEVVVEGRSKKNPAHLTGRTRQHKLVHFSMDGFAAGAPLPVGTYARVEVTGATRFHLAGRLVEVGDAPRHRVRIPVAVA
jgi:tRNA-2-methylthio-N6-dimethylallyladenosine synthase